jgi:hypothetical protein
MNAKPQPEQSMQEQQIRAALKCALPQIKPGASSKLSRLLK